MAERYLRRPPEVGAIRLPQRRASAARAGRVVWTIWRHALPAYLGGRGLTRRSRAVDAVGQAFVELGPTFVKLGQMISANPTIFPPAAIEAFSRCQDQCDPQPFAAVEKIVKEELGHDLKEFFSSFDPEPIASGSIAQVHRATTVDGREVAVKVQRLGLANLLSRDLALMSFATRWLVRLRPAYEVTNPAGVVDDFRHTLSEELAFRVEARRMDELRGVFADWPIVIPVVHHDLSTDRVLVMELVSGIKIDQVDELTAAGLEPSRLADLLISSFLYSAMHCGTFHGDGHPGNLSALSGNRICMYDFGIMGRLADQDRIQASRFFRALNLQRFDLMAESLLTLADLSEANLEGAMADIEVLTSELMGPDGDFKLAEVDFAKVLTSFLTMANRHRLILPTDLILVFKQLLYLNGLAICLEPELSVFDGDRYFEFFAPDDGLADLPLEATE